MLGVLFLLVSCAQPEPNEPPTPTRPSDAVVEQVIDFGLVDSFGLNVALDDGEYVITGEWQVDPNEDPNTQYWLLAGNSAGKFVPIASFTSSDARPQVQTAEQATDPDLNSFLLELSPPRARSVCKLA